MIHWSSGREGHNNYRRDLMIWLVHLIYTVRLAKVALCYNYVILNYCIRFAVLPCVRLCLNSCLFFTIQSAIETNKFTFDVSMVLNGIERYLKVLNGIEWY